MTTGRDSRAWPGAVRAQETLAKPIPPRPRLSPLSQECSWQPQLPRSPLTQPHPYETSLSAVLLNPHLGGNQENRWVCVISPDHTAQSA